MASPKNEEKEAKGEKKKKEKHVTPEGSIVRAYKHKLSFTPEQECLARQYAGCYRLIYNLALEQRKLGYLATRRGISAFSQIKYLKELRAAYDFLAACPTHILQAAIRDVEAAYRNFFAGRAKFPKPHKKGYNDGFRYPDPDPKQIGVHNPARQNQVRLPKLGWVSVPNSYPNVGDHKLFEGDLRYVTIKREADGWYASFTAEVKLTITRQYSSWRDELVPLTHNDEEYSEEELTEFLEAVKSRDGSINPELYVNEQGELARRPMGEPIGLDFGIENSIALSTGEMIHLPVMNSREREKLILLHQAVSRKQLGSRNREKAERELARFYQYIKNRRVDATHKLTTRLAREHSIICLEDLKITNMTKSAKGTIEEPGSMVAQKSGLNRSILEQAWGEVKRQLAYKTTWYGSELVFVNPAFTSQECNNCGYTAKENRDSQALFLCRECGYEIHADTGASRNVVLKGLVIWTGGTLDPESTDSKACEERLAVGESPQLTAPSRNQTLRSVDQIKV